MRFVYSVIRFVPDPARGEFVNVGAVVGSDLAGEWDMRMVASLRRARALDDAHTLKAVLFASDEIGQKIDQTNEREGQLISNEDFATEAWLTTLWEQSNNIVQLSRPAPITADNAKQAMDVIFEELVVDPETTALPYKRKTPAVAAIRAAYVDMGMRRDSNFIERAVVQGSHHRERMDFVVANGKAVQLAHAWSFQVPGQEELTENIKAWAFTVRDIRNKGGVVLGAKGGKLDIPPDVDVAAVFIAPLTDTQERALNEARAAFEDPEVRVRFVEMKDALSEVGVQAKERLEHSIAG